MMDEKRGCRFHPSCLSLKWNVKGRNEGRRFTEDLKRKGIENKIKSERSIES